MPCKAKKEHSGARNSHTSINQEQVKSGASAHVQVEKEEAKKCDRRPKQTLNTVEKESKGGGVEKAPCYFGRSINPSSDCRRQDTDEFMLSGIPGLRHFDRSGDRKCNTSILSQCTVAGAKRQRSIACGSSSCSQAAYSITAKSIESQHQHGDSSDNCEEDPCGVADRQMRYQARLLSVAVGEELVQDRASELCLDGFEKSSSSVSLTTSRRVSDSNPKWDTVTLYPRRNCYAAKSQKEPCGPPCASLEEEVGMPSRSFDEENSSVGRVPQRLPTVTGWVQPLPRQTENESTSLTEETVNSNKTAPPVHSVHEYFLDKYGAARPFRQPGATENIVSETSRKTEAISSGHTDMEDLRCMFRRTGARKNHCITCLSLFTIS